MIGQAYDEQNVWWELDKEQIPGGKEADSLWVSSDDVGEKGDCLAVVRVEAPPVVIGHRRRRPAPGGCGSCDTCGHPGECVTSPDGACLWDPATCHHEIVTPPPGDGCYQVSTQVNIDNPGSGSITLRPSPNCGNGYIAGTSITAVASSICQFIGWGGSTCPISGGRWLPLRLRVTALVANFNC